MKKGDKVKVIAVPGSGLYDHFLGRVGVASDTRGTSGETTRVDFADGGGLFLREEQVNIVE